jgi:PAS domain S-box-containing protein
MDELQRSQEIYRILMHTSMDGCTVVDVQGRYLEVNDAYCQMMGYSREELLTMTISDVEAVESQEEAARHIQQMMALGQDRFETRLRRKDGQLVDVEVSARFMSDRERPCFFSFERDITQRKQFETQRLAHSVVQRDALVREVHHHIKNNLQGVAALLQQQVVESPEAGAALKKAIARVRAVAVVHGLQGEAYSQVALCDVVRAISQDLQELTTLPLRLEMVPHFKPVLLADAESVPIALIVNELLFNAVKHAATTQADQAIHVILQGSENEMSLIVYCVYGCLPQDFDFAAGRGLGMGLTLVKSLLPPAGASLSIANADGGVRAELRLTSPVLIHNDAIQGDAS